MVTTDARPTAGARRRAAAHNDDDLDFELDPERLPSVDDVTDVVQEYLNAAREAINDTVERETRGLRKAIRRQRKRVGV